MDEKTEHILELLKWLNADELKKVQTKFTKTANAIKADAIEGRLKALYDDKELDVLRQAVSILNDTKRKIEHAKEIKRRDEQARDKRLAGYEKTKRALVKELLPLDATPEQAIEALTWWLALDRYLLDYLGKSSFESNRFKFIGGVQNRIKEMKNPELPEKLNGLINQCIHNVQGLIGQELWDYDVEPRREDLDALIEIFKTEWKPQVEQLDADLIDDVKGLLDSQAFISSVKDLIK